MQSKYRTRTVVAWSPQWDGPVKAWAQNFIRKNSWRCDRIYNEQDLLQEAYIIFDKLCKMYPRVIEAPNFMRLFQRSLKNFFHDKSSYMQRKQKCHVDTPQDVTELFSAYAGETTNAGYLCVLLDEAPQDLKLALALLASNPTPLRTSVKPKEPRENLNMKLRRILGLVDPDFDLKASLLSHLGSDT